jgi:TolB-like protein
MKSRLIIIFLLSFILCGQAFGEVEEIDKVLSDLASRLAGPVKEQGKKKVAVIDFTDLQGGSSELGKYIAEQLTVDLVLVKRDFSVLDRANLKNILAEHKLTATGLVNPDNAKKLGMFAGVDALILGTIVPKSQTVNLTAKIISTDTAEIVGAAKATFKTDESVQQLLSHPAIESKAASAEEAKNESPAVVKTFGNLRVELPFLKVLDGKGYLLTMVLSNPSKKSIWVAVKMQPNGVIPAVIMDSNQTEFEAVYGGVSGVAMSPLDYQNKFSKATEIGPGDSITATAKFATFGKTATPGACRLQMEILAGPSFRDGEGAATAHNLVTQIEAK